MEPRDIKTEGNCLGRWRGPESEARGVQEEMEREFN